MPINNTHFQPKINMLPSIKLLWKRSRSSKLINDVSRLLLLQGINFIVMFFASSYAMRILGPEQLGIGAFVLSIVSQGRVLGDLGLSITGVRIMGNQPERRSEVASLVFGIRFRAAVVVSILMLLCVWIFHLIGNISLWIMAVPLLILTVLSPQWVFQGMERIPNYNIYQLIISIFTALMYFTLFRRGSTAELYIIVALFTQGLGWGLSYAWLRGQIKIDWKYFNYKQAWELIRESKNAFAIVLTIFFYTSLDIPLITLFLSTEQAGIYRASQTVVGVILALQMMLPLIFYPRLIAWKNISKQVFIKNALLLMLSLSFLSIVLDIGAFIAVPILFPALLGQEFITGIWPCILLFVAKGFVLVGSIPSWGLLAFGRDRYQLLVTCLAALVSIVINLSMITRIGIYAPAIAAIISELVISVFSTIFLINYLRSNKFVSEK